MNLKNKNQSIRSCIENISRELDANIFLYSASITDSHADKLIQEIRKVSQKKKNVALVMTTYGGDPDAAYRIARYLKRKYEKFILYVFGFCKSAGTLLALGADVIVISDFGQLGPLDIQVFKTDEFQQGSGLDIQQALSVIGSQSFEVFEHCFLGILARSQANITTKTAADIASSISVGLLSPISSQIDPIRLGEMNRLMEIALAYGERLNPDKRETLSKLIFGYPSHSFVIDYEEAEDLFQCVREPTEVESLLEEAFSTYIYQPQEVIAFLDEMGQYKGEDEEDAEENRDEYKNRSEAVDEGTPEESAQENGLQNEATEQNNLLSHKNE